MKKTALLAILFMMFSSVAYSCNDEYINYMNSIIEETRQDIDGVIAENMPNSIIIAQAVLETGYGKSRAARRQNNHFGMSSQNRIMTYGSVEENVEAYFVNLSNHNAYRKLRETLESDNYDLPKIINSYAGYYAEDPHYSRKVLSVINSCKLNYYDSNRNLFAQN